MARNSVAIRLGVEGGADVRREFQSVGDAGEQAAQRLGRQFEQQSAVAERAAQRAARTARTLAEMQAVTPVQARINEVTGVDRSVGNSGAARASAAAFMELEQRSQSLKASLDPLYVAQQRLNAGMEEARSLHAAGALSAGELAAAQQRLQAQYLQTATASRAANDNNGMLRAGYQQLGFQISDVGAMLAAGASPAIVFGTQASQILQALNMIGEGKSAGAAGGAGEALAGLNDQVADASGNFEALQGGVEQASGMLEGFAGAEEKAGAASDKKKTKMQAMMGFMGGPWGAVLVGGIALLATFAGGLFEAEETVESLTDAMVENAAKAELQRQASEAFAATMQGQIEAVRKLIAANEQLGKSEDTRRDATLARLASFDEESTQVREMLEERIELGRFAADLDRTSNWESMGIGSGAEAREQMDLAIDRLNEIDAALARVGVTLPDTGSEVDAFIQQLRGLADEAERTQRALRFDSLVAAIAAEGDAAAQERLRHERTLEELGSAVRSGDADDQARVEELVRAEQRQHDQNMRNIEAQKEAERDRQQEAERSQREREQLERRRRETIEGIERETAAANELAAAYRSSGAATILQAQVAARAANDVRELGLDQAAHQERVRALMLAETLRDAEQQRFTFADEAADTNFALSNMTTSWVELDNVMEQNRLTAELRRQQFDKDGNEIASVTDAIRRLREAHDELTASQRRLQLYQAFGGLVADQADAAALARIGNSETRPSAVARARIGADRQIAEQGWDSADWFGAAMFRRQTEANAGEKWDAETAAYFTNQTTARQRGIDLLREEESLLGRNRRERELELRLIEMASDLNQRFGGEYAEQSAALLEIVRAEEERKIALERTFEAMAEFDQLAGGVIDELFNMDNWNDWEAAGIRVLKSLAQEMLILAAANPLKNMLLGGDRPTLGGILGTLFNLGSTVAGAAAGGGGGAFGGGRSGGFATGTLAYPGGWALMGENGPEIARLPRGSQISTAAETRRMLGSNDNRPQVVNHWSIDARGAGPREIDELKRTMQEMDNSIEARSLAAYHDARERTYGRV